jgi:hypothetical protein
VAGRAEAPDFVVAVAPAAGNEEQVDSAVGIVVEVRVDSAAAIAAEAQPDSVAAAEAGSVWAHSVAVAHSGAAQVRCGGSAQGTALSPLPAPGSARRTAAQVASLSSSLFPGP